MRLRSIAGLLAVTAALGLISGAAPARPDRESKRYLVAGAAVGFLGLGIGGVQFTPPAGATTVRVVISDDVASQNGVPTAGTVCQDANGDGTCEGGRSFCRKTNTPVAIRPGFDVNVFVAGAEMCGSSPAIGTTGTVTATFSVPKVPPAPSFKVLSRKTQRETYPFAATAALPVSFMPPAKATHVEIQIMDAGGQALGLPTGATACQDNNDNRVCGEEGETSLNFCTETKNSLPIKPGIEVSVFVSALDLCPDGGVAIGTTGSVRATFLITAPIRAARR